MITISDKAKCCGCSACASSCPRNCINMNPDNEGFRYPEVNESLCVNCGLCERVCPILNPVKEDVKMQKAYLVQIKNEAIRRESTSGGAFTAIAQYIISKGGVVFGVTFDERMQAVHRYVKSEGDLKFFRGSKYVQSHIGETFQQVKRFLNENKWVCFSGTPCQIEGLKSYLGKDYDNLITVDIVCHAVPSPFIWDKYFQMQKGKYGNCISEILFRDKYYGYKYSTMTIYTSKDNSEPVYHKGVETDVFLRAFFSDICDRPSCYQCAFKKRYRVSDVTLWDCFNVDSFDIKMDDDKGTTRVLIQSPKGDKIFSAIKHKVEYCCVDADMLVKGVHEMFYSVNINPKRDAFFAESQVLNGEALFKKYFPDTFKVKLERFARLTCNRLGVYKPMKTIYIKMRCFSTRIMKMRG